MVSHEQARSVALFFLLSLPEERLAVSAAEKAIKEINSRLPKSSGGEDLQADVLIVETCLRIRGKLKAKNVKPKARAPGPPKWSVPPSIQFDHWKRFMQEAGDDEVIALLLAQVCGFEEADVADALNVSVGTVRSRVSRAVSHLGRLSRGGKEDAWTF